MKTIYKYKLEIKEEQVIDAPYTASLLKIDFQNGELRAWFQVDTNYMKGKRKFWIVGTGHEIPKVEGSLIWRDTFQTPPFVWHIYEEQGFKED